jgi:RHS repeat-associated protein
MNKTTKFLKHAAFTLPIVGMMIALEAHAHVPNTNSARFRDQNDMGCHMSPGAAGAPVSGAAGAGGNQASCTNCQSGSDSGISRWWVNEPYENLHISDAPLSYFMSSGQRMVFRWLYKQRYKLPDIDEVPNLYDSSKFRLMSSANPYQSYMRNYGMTNASWSHNWMMDILFWNSTWEAGSHNTAPVFTNGYEALVFRPEGSVEYFSTTGGMTNNSTSQAALRPVSALANLVLTNSFPSSDTNGIYWGDPGNGFKIVYPDGSQDVFGLSYFQRSMDTLTGVPRGGESTAHALLTQRVDPQGRTSLLGYESGTFGLYTYYRVRYVVDPDGRTNTFLYQTNSPTFGWQLIEIDDPYGRKAQLNYYGSGSFSNGLLASISDAVSNTSSFAYQGTNGWITNLTTPYGTTAFTFYSNQDLTITNGYSQRAVYVSEPEGAQQLYCYLHTNSLLTASATGPTVSGQTFDTGATNGNSGTGSLIYRNTFHWDRLQFTALSSGVTSSLPSGMGFALASLSTADLKKGAMEHWLLSSADEVTITESISSDRLPSPDAGGQTEGTRVWYNYASKPSPEEDGDAQLNCVAQVLPDGNTQYTLYRYTNGTGLVYQNESSYTLANGSIGTRTNYFQYATNAVDLVTVSNSGGQFLNIAYNTNHQAIYVTDALNELTQLSYLATHNLGAITNPSGLSATLIYYAPNPATANGSMLSSIAWPATGRSFSFTYTNGLPLTVADDLGLRVTNSWDGLNRLTGTVFPDRSSISNVYDRLWPSGIKDRLGNWSTAAYDALEHPTSITDARSNVTQLTWCNCGSLTSIIDPLTNTTLLYYNNQGLATNLVFADLSTRTNFFDSIQRLTAVADGTNRTLTFGYNNQGLLTSISNVYGSLESVLFDALDRPVQVTDANNVTLTHSFDLLDRLLSRSYPAGGVVEGFLWSTNGLLAYTNQDQQVTWFNRDSAFRLLSVTNAKLEVVWLNYNSLNEVTGLWDGNSNHTVFGFNEYGWLTNKVNGLGREVLRLTRNANGQVTNRWTPEFGNTVYSRDPLGNVTNITYPQYSVAYSRDPLGRITNMVDQAGTNAFSYTQTGQLHTEDGPWANDTLTFGYSQGLRTSLSLNSQPSTLNHSYGYDSAWRLGNLSTLAGVFTYGYGGSPGSLVRTIGLPNAAYATNHFDGLNRLDYTALINYWGHVLDGYSYTHDPLGLRTNIVRDFGLTNNSLTVGYDAVGQLVSWSAKESSGSLRLNEQLGFGFDKAHNLQSRTNGALIQTFNIDRGNEVTNISRTGTLTVSGAMPAPATIVTVGATVAERYGDLTFAATNVSLINGTNTFTIVAQNTYGTNATNVAASYLPSPVSLAYDSNGNLTNDGTRSFSYSAANQLTNVTGTNVTAAGSWKSEFVYDGLGRRRIERDYKWQSGWVLTNETRYIYDGFLLVQQRDSNNVVQVSYTRGLDLSGTVAGAGGIGGLLARTDANGNSTFYHSDGAGNVTTLVDAQQNIAARYLYGPFGNLIGRWGKLADANSMQLSSMPKHGPSGLSGYPFRFYDPTLQRFLNQDPIGEAGGMNLYGLAANSPLNGVDPLGLDLFQYNTTRSQLENGESVPPPGPLPYFGGANGPGEAIVESVNNAVSLAGNSLLFGAEVITDFVKSLFKNPQDAEAAEAMMLFTPLELERALAGLSGEAKACRYRGGKHGDIKKPGLDRHHMPAKQASPLKESEGPAIQMEPADHRRTASYGGGPDSPQQAYRDIQQALLDQGRFDEAFLMDVEDIQSKFGSKYDDAIVQAIDALPKKK